MSPNLSTPSRSVEIGSSIRKLLWLIIIAVLFPGADGSDMDAWPDKSDAEEPRSKSSMLMAFFLPAWIPQDRSAEP